MKRCCLLPVVVGLKVRNLIIFWVRCFLNNETEFFDILEKSKKLLDESLLFYRSQFASSFNYGGLKVGGRVIITISKFFKATKGAWWMPWL